MSNQTVINELYHWPICPNCAAGLSEVDVEELEACSQCGVKLNPADYETRETKTMKPKRRWRRVEMNEIMDIHIALRSRGECYNGCTFVELIRIYGEGNVVHKQGRGWYKLTAS